MCTFTSANENRLNMKLKLYNRDEIFLLNLNAVLYFKAEDHYTSVYYGKDAKQLLPFGLSQLENAIAEQGADPGTFVRAGRSHLLNIGRVVHASVTKETVTMIGRDDAFVTIHVARNVVRDLARSMKDGDAAAGGKSRGGVKASTIYYDNSSGAPKGATSEYTFLACS